MSITPNAVSNIYHNAQTGGCTVQVTLPADYSRDLKWECGVVCELLHIQFVESCLETRPQNATADAFCGGVQVLETKRIGSNNGQVFYLLCMFLFVYITEFGKTVDPRSIQTIDQRWNPLGWRYGCNSAIGTGVI
jgi:hypothetical protein